MDTEEDINRADQSALDNADCYAFAHKAPSEEPALHQGIPWIHWRRNQPDLPSLKEAVDELFQKRM